MNGARKTVSLAGQISKLLLLAAVLALVYNSFSVKSIPLIRKAQLKVAASDSDLFRGREPSRGDSGAGQQGPAGVKVIAPLHERALAQGDSAAAASPEKKEAEMYRIITLSQLTRLMEGDHNLLLDARDTAAYRKGNIKGARNMFGLATDLYFAELAPMPRDTLVLIYCNNPDCHLGRMLAEFMHAIGFKSLYLYDDGWDGWVKAGMPVDSTIAPGP